MEGLVLSSDGPLRGLKSQYHIHGDKSKKKKKSILNRGIKGQVIMEKQDREIEKKHKRSSTTGIITSARYEIILMYLFIHLFLSRCHLSFLPKSTLTI